MFTLVRPDYHTAFRCHIDAASSLASTGKRIWGTELESALNVLDRVKLATIIEDTQEKSQVTTL